MTRIRPGAKGTGRLFGSINEVLYAHESNDVHLQAAVKARVQGKIYETSVGRVIFSDMLPAEVPFDIVNKPLGKKQLAELVDKSFRLAGGKATAILADKIMEMGFAYSTKAGISICLDDLKIPDTKKEMIESAEQEVLEIEAQYDEGLITDGERYNKVVDIWAQTGDKVAKVMMAGIETEKFNIEGKDVVDDSFNSIFVMADSGARGSAAQIRQLAGMRGLMAKPSGEIIETPITANFREGLSVLQYFISTHGARKGLADTALKTANSGYLTRRLVDVSQDVVINEIDCGTDEGIEMTALVESGEVIESLGERVLGRTVLEDVRDPYNDELLVGVGEEITEFHVKKIDKAGVDKIHIRSVLTCKTRRGVCVKCYGRDLARGTTVNLGEAVGVIAAQSIGEPGTQLTMRTFHLGGTASRAVEQSLHTARMDATVKLEDIRSVTDKNGQLVSMNRSGYVVLLDSEGRERDRLPVVYGTTLLVKDGDTVKKGDTLCEWDPYANPIIAEVSGAIEFLGIVEGRTMSEQLDSVTGFATKVITDSKLGDDKPTVLISDKDGKLMAVEGRSTPARYVIPVGAQLLINEGVEVHAGDVIAKLHRETSKTKDITGGLPRVAELFEARKPKEAAIVTEIDGYISFGKDVKTKQRVIVTPDVGEHREYLIPKGKHFAVREGEYVKAGDALMDGPTNPHDVLAVKGVKALAEYLVNEVQEVYRLQGVGINDKHIEVIVRQMLSKVTVTHPGDTVFLNDMQVDRFRVEIENERVIAENGEPAQYTPLLLGITRVSLSTESWISAASFQETTKVLTEAAINAKEDGLDGLKENIIMGRLIPAGTGVQAYKKWKIQVDNNDEGLTSSLPGFGGAATTTTTTTVKDETVVRGV